MTVNLQALNSLCPRDWGRHVVALQRRREGKTLVAIGVEMGLSRGRVHQMVRAEERREKDLLAPEAKPFNLLSARTRNCLFAAASFRHPEVSVQDVRNWRDSGRLGKIEGIGQKTIQEVEAWLDALGS